MDVFSAEFAANGHIVFLYFGRCQHGIFPVDASVEEFHLAAGVNDVFHLSLFEMEYFGRVEHKFFAKLEGIPLHAIGLAEQVDIDEHTVIAAQAAQALDVMIEEKVCRETEIVESFFDICHRDVCVECE